MKVRASVDPSSQCRGRIDAGNINCLPQSRFRTEHVTGVAAIASTPWLRGPQLFGARKVSSTNLGNLDEVPSQTFCFRVSATVTAVTAAETGTFKGRHFDRSVILLCIRWYLAYNLSLRNLEEMMAERGISVDHATIHRWVIRYSPELLKRFNARKRVVTRKCWGRLIAGHLQVFFQIRTGSSPGQARGIIEEGLITAERRRAAVASAGGRGSSQSTAVAA
jgi:hypothetical protein